MFEIRTVVVALKPKMLEIKIVVHGFQFMFFL